VTSNTVTSNAVTSNAVTSNAVTSNAVTSNTVTMSRFSMQTLSRSAPASLGVRERIGRHSDAAAPRPISVAHGGACPNTQGFSARSSLAPCRIGRIDALVDRLFPSRALTILFLVLALPRCGGSGAGSGPGTANDVESDQPQEATVEAFDTAAESGGEAPSTEPCAGGSCTRCADTVCLSGFYCDERANACSWVPACAKDPTCACLERALPACQCEEREGGLHVSCNDN
jgi:hypothetical protein